MTVVGVTGNYCGMTDLGEEKGLFFPPPATVATGVLAANRLQGGTTSRMCC